MRSRLISGGAGLLALLVLLLTAATGSSAASATSAASAASAAAPTLRIREAAAVQARGAGIAFDVVLVCMGTRGRQTLVAEVTQRQADGSVVRGGAHRYMPCTGAEQVVRMVVAPVLDAFNQPRNPTGPPFRRGAAVVDVRAPYCPEASCPPVEASRTVQATATVMNAAALTGPRITGTLPSSGSLEADGAGVKIRVPYSCPTGFYGFVEAFLVQRTSAAAVTSVYKENTYLPCTGAQRTGVLSFHAGLAAWRTGDALLIVSAVPTSNDYLISGKSVYAHRRLSLA